MECDADLFQVIAALSAAGGFAGLLYGGQQQSHEDRDDGDDDEEFDQGETSKPTDRRGGQRWLGNGHRNLRLSCRKRKTKKCVLNGDCRAVRCVQASSFVFSRW